MSFVDPPSSGDGECSYQQFFCFSQSETSVGCTQKALLLKSDRMAQSTKKKTVKELNVDVGPSVLRAPAEQTKVATVLGN
jgi:hypothetical protein